MIPQTSQRSQQFTESVIREMTRLANAHQAVNLAQGFPDFDPPSVMLEKAIAAIAGGMNQYAITWGAKTLRDAIAKKAKAYQGIEVDPETEVTVTCGSTEAMIATLLAIVNKGDEVIIFEPFYENYGPDAILSQASPRYVTLHPPLKENGEWFFDFEDLAKAFNNKTKAIILNSPNNPTGKVFTQRELEFIAGLCRKWNAFAVTDEIYEHMCYDGTSHTSLATLPGMKERTIVINAISKTYSATGWRVGWAVAAPQITGAIRKVHDFLTVGAPHPFQEAASVALDLPSSYYVYLAQDYLKRRDFLLSGLQEAGFKCWKPYGAYYIMTNFSSVNKPPHLKDDRDFAEWLVKDVGVAAVPGSSFYHEGKMGASQIRFSFGRKMEMLVEASKRLGKLRQTRHHSGKA